MQEYLVKFYPGKYNIDSKDFQFQELVRRSDAEFIQSLPSKTGDKQMQNRLWNFFIYGWISKNHIDQYLSRCLGLSPGFKECMGREFWKLANSDISMTSNIRSSIRSILLYPHTDYSPWIEVSQPDSPVMLRVANDILKRFDGVGSVSIVGNRMVYALPGILNRIWQEFQDNPSIRTCIQSISPHFERNYLEIDKISLINLNRQYNPAELWEFLRCNSGNDLKFVSVKHTYSVDWSLFSACLVLEALSPSLQGMIGQFEKKFGYQQQQQNCFIHLPIAIVPRIIK